MESLREWGTHMITVHLIIFLRHNLAISATLRHQAGLPLAQPMAGSHPQTAVTRLPPADPPTPPTGGAYMIEVTSGRGRDWRLENIPGLQITDDYPGTQGYP